MIYHKNITDRELFSLMKNKKILFAGRTSGKIYGRLDCASGKRMHRKNRVFFRNEKESISAGYRRCKKCMKL